MTYKHKDIATTRLTQVTGRVSEKGISLLLLSKAMFVLVKIPHSTNSESSGGTLNITDTGQKDKQTKGGGCNFNLNFILFFFFEKNHATFIFYFYLF